MSAKVVYIAGAVRSDSTFPFKNDDFFNLGQIRHPPLP